VIRCIHPKGISKAFARLQMTSTHSQEKITINMSKLKIENFIITNILHLLLRGELTIQLDNNRGKKEGDDCEQKP
jgi:hypothetical protein